MAGGPIASGGGLTGPGNKLVAYILTAFAGFGGILFGYDTGTINGIQTMDAWIQTFGSGPEGHKVLSTSDQSVVVSILSTGTFFGALMAAPLADSIGRRFSMIASCLIFSLGVGLQLPTNWPCFITGRLIAGLGVGLISCLCPMYQSETSPKAWRGLVIGLYQWAVTIGILLAAIVNNFMATRNDNSGWRWVVALQFVWAAILIIGMVWLPESPRYLCLKGREGAAKQSLHRITALRCEELDVAFAVLSEGLAAESLQGQASYADLFKGGPDRMWFRTITGTGIQAMQQLSGINFIFYYGTTFFLQSGISDPFIISIVTNVVNVVMTVPGILFIDRLGRRSMLLIGASGMCICQFIVAIVGVSVRASDLAAQRVLIAFVCIYIAFFASTFGPIPWCVSAEVFPSRLRAKGMSLSLGSNWLWNFAIGYATPYLVNPSTEQVRTAGLGVKVFFVWGSACVGAFLFTYFFVAETKSLSLEQIDDLYRHSSVLKSNSYRRSIIKDQALHVAELEQQVHVSTLAGALGGDNDKDATGRVSK